MRILGGNDVFPAKAEVEREPRVHFVIVLNESGSVRAAVAILHLAFGPHALIRLDRLDIAAARRTEVIGGGEAQQKVAECLKGHFAAGRTGILARRLLGQNGGSRAHRVIAANPGEIVRPGIGFGHRSEIVSEIAEKPESA